MSGLVCIVYVSSSKTSLLSRLVEVAGRSLVHSFQDSTYNRTSFYLLQPYPSSGHTSIAEIAWRVCNEALSQLDFTQHQGTHPTLGVVDHICFSPLGSTTIQEASTMAKMFAMQLNEVNRVPIYFYGGLSSKLVKLADLRKSELMLQYVEYSL